MDIQTSPTFPLPGRFALDMLWEYIPPPTLRLGQQDFFPGMGKLGVWGRKSPNGVQGWSLGVGVGRNPQKPTKSAISLQ